jgi:DNA polymerase III epsilon subunit family exonuclease
LVIADRDSERPPIRLSDEQRRIVEFPDQHRHLLISAPAGSGKTLVITYRILHLLERSLADPEQVLALTFTERAARELQDRLAALGAFGVGACTFHAFCAQQLRDHGERVGLGPVIRIRDEPFQRSVLDESAKELGISIDDRKLAQVRNAISRRKRENCPVEHAAAIAELSWPAFEAIELRYHEKLREANGVDFDDLIVLTSDLIWNDRDVSGSIHHRYRFLFVDEFHDVSAEQFRLIAAVAPSRVADRQVMAVADRNQAIYRFRGADVEEMLRLFQHEYRPHRFSLRLNYRSSATIVEASRALLAPRPSDDQPMATKPADLQVDCYRCSTEREEAQLIEGLIRRASSCGYRYEDMAILYRTHRRGDYLDQELIRHSIPIERMRPDRFFNREQVQEVMRYLDLLGVLNDESLVPALNWPRVLVDELSMIKLRRAARCHGAPISQIARDHELLRQIATPTTRHTIERFLAEVVDELLDVVEDDIDVIVPRLLACLSKRRDPIPAADREDLRGLIDFLTGSLEGAAAELEVAIADQRPISLFCDDDCDCMLAAALVQQVVAGYYGVVAQIRQSASSHDGYAMHFSTAPASARTMATTLAPRSTRTTSLTVTAQAYRLCQLLLMRHERLHLDRFVVFDLETTSAHAGTAEIMQIGAVVVVDGKVTDERFSTLVRPSGAEAITRDAVDVHGLTWKAVRDAPSPAEALQRFLSFAGDAVLAGHNIERFDHLILKRQVREAGLPIPENFTLDTYALAKRLRPDGRHRLDDLLTSEERNERGQHEALNDAIAGGQVLLRLLDQLQNEREVDLITEHLPLVGASEIASERAKGHDSVLFARLGARTAKLGVGARPSQVFASVGMELHTEELDRALGAHDPGIVADDLEWEATCAEWITQVGAFAEGAADRSLGAFLHYANLAAQIDPGFPVDSSGRVTMSTIHSAKGREWPLVFLLGCEDETFIRSTASPEDIEEERRVFYVGMTRAIRRLLLTHVDKEQGHSRGLLRFVSETESQIQMKRYCPATAPDGIAE